MTPDYLEKIAPIINYRLPTGLGKQMAITHIVIGHTFFYGDDALFLFLTPVLGLQEQDMRFMMKTLPEYGIEFEKAGPKRLKIKDGPMLEFQTIMHFLRKDKDIPAIDKLIVNSNYFDRYIFTSNQVIRDARKMLKSGDDHDVIGVMIDEKNDVLTDLDVMKMWGIELTPPKVKK